jgi:hypothetical protein
MHHTKITVFVTLSAVSAFLMMLSLTSLAGGGVRRTSRSNHDPGIGLPAGVNGLTLTGADSVKKHGTLGAGTVFPIPMPLSATLTDGMSGIEDRAGGDSDRGGTGDYTIVLHFSNSLVSVESVSVTDHNPPCMMAGATNLIGCGAVGSFEISGNDILVHLIGVTDAQVLTITTTKVSDGTQTINPDPVAVGFLKGDTTSNRTVNASDISQTKAHDGESVDSTNFRTDITHNGEINASDISAAKAASGTGAP